MREIYSLNNNWEFVLNYRPEYINHEIESSLLQQIDLPHTNVLLPYNDFNEKDYQIKSLYRKNLYIDSKWNDQCIVLSFEGVMVYAQVFINGSMIGEHKGGFTPFYFHLEDFVTFGQDNLLEVVVDANEIENIPPYGYVMDYLSFGGIYREVYLSVLNKTHIKDLFVRTAYNRELEIHIEFENFNYLKETTLVFELISKEKETVYVHEETIEIKDVPHIHQTEIHDVVPWELNNPYLYDLYVSIYNHGDKLDTKSIRFGFREAIFTKDGFYLNGKRIKLVGLNRHQSFPYVGFAMPKSGQVLDADLMKNELNLNIVRTAHYPPSKHFIERCDEIGLLVFEEMPGWRHIGKGEWVDTLLINLEEMIKRDRNNPSVVLWGVRINESIDDYALYKQTNKLAKLLDPTRQTSGARNFRYSRLLEDVYAFNDYTHAGSSKVIKSPKEVTFKRVPYIITEHNGHMFPTKKFDNELIRVEHAIRHMRVLNASLGNSNVSACIGWCLADYNTHKYFGSGDQICYHGVLDLFRIPKLAAAVYSSQTDDKPVLIPSSMLHIGDVPASKIKDLVLFTNCDYVDVFKQDQFIKRYYPDRIRYPYLKHAPIIVNDYIGNEIIKNEQWSSKDSDRLKQVLWAMNEFEPSKMPLPHLLLKEYLMIKYRFDRGDFSKLYSKYMTNWSAYSSYYELRGHIKNELVITKKIGSLYASDLIVEVDSNTLFIGNTYDVTRIVVRCVDVFNNDQIYCEEVIEVNIEGPIELIGPNKIPLIGGSTAFWVKTKKQTGEANVTIVSSRFTNKSIQLKIEKNTCNEL